MFLSGRYLFGNTAIQISAMIIYTVEFVVQEVSPFYNFMHKPGKPLTWAFNSAWGGVGWGSPTRLAQLAVPEEAPPLRTRRGVGKRGYENFCLASVWNGFKKFCMWRMEMLIYLLNSFILFEGKINWLKMVWYLGRVLKGK